MKIAMLGHKRIPSREGGVEVVVEELATRMAALGHQVVVYNRKEKKKSRLTCTKTSLKEYKNIKIIQIPTIEKGGWNALVYSVLASVHATFGKYDVIHYHAEGPCAMLWLPKLFGTRIIATIHGLDWKRAKWGGLAKKYIKLGEKIAVKKADQIIVLSENMRKYFYDTYKRETVYLPNGLTVPKKRKVSAIRKQFGLEKNGYILFLARIVPEKGVHYLIQAFKMCNTEKKLVIAGDCSHTCEYYKKIKKMAETDPRIRMLGFVQGNILEELFSNCSFYVLPSDVEGMPISLLEAMGYGRPCLISDIPENLELAGQYAVSFKQGNVEDLKEKLQELLQRETTEQCASIAYVREKFDWNVIVKETLKVYQMQEKSHP